MVIVTSITKIGPRIRLILGDGYEWWMTLREYNRLHIYEGAEIDPEVFRQTVIQLQFPRGLSLAVSCLARRACSKEEILRTLARNHYDSEVIDLILYKLEKNGFLDDSEFCAQWIHYRSSGKYGINRIHQELRQKGVSEQIAAEALNNISPDDQLNQAVEFARKKRKLIKDHSDPYKAKGKIIQALVRRGFSWDIAKKAYDLSGSE
jgi:regulatory protein